MERGIDRERLQGRRLLLGVTGGVAAYKAAELARSFVKEGILVDTILTANGARFITPLTFASLTGRPALTEMFDETVPGRYVHLDLARQAELVVVAPATANLLGKLAGGIADDLLTTTLLSVKCPVLIAPAMNTRMWQNPIVERNVKELKSLGYHFVDPVEGTLGCGEEGIGKLAPVEEITLRVLELLSQAQDLTGFNVLITAGATREALDPVRFISNPATGKMGFALAEAARLRGAKVALISGPTSLTPPSGVRFIQVTTAVEMLEVIQRSYSDCHILISAAAVSDYSPESPQTKKMKKTDEEIEVRFKPSPDILHIMGQQKGRRIHVGFAMETGDLEKNALAKLEAKNLDMIVANDLTVEGAGFAVDTNVVTILDRSGAVETYPKLAKRTLAYLIIDRIVELVQERMREAGGKTLKADELLGGK